MNWLYRRSTKEVSFVRTGLGGERVVINGGHRGVLVALDPWDLQALLDAGTRAGKGIDYRARYSPRPPLILDLETGEAR